MKIKIDHITKKYEKSIIFRDLCYEFNIENSVTALLGPNGAGKTTFMKLISGILCQHSGSIQVIDSDSEISDSYVEWAHKNIAYLSPDERYLSFKNNGIDNILYFGIIKGVDKKTILQNLEIFMQHIECKSYINKRIEQLSTGQKKVIKLLSIFCTGLPILLLDEPTVGLDIDTREILIEMISLLSNCSNNKVIISTHDLDFAASISSNQIYIYNGEIKLEHSGKNSVDELKEQYELMKKSDEKGKSKC
ncbi:MAG: ABC transporter ATP-binding protein [Longicatena sp.]